MRHLLEASDVTRHTRDEKKRQVGYVRNSDDFADVESSVLHDEPRHMCPHVWLVVFPQQVHHVESPTTQVIATFLCDTNWFSWYVNKLVCKSLNIAKHACFIIDTKEN